MPIDIGKLDTTYSPTGGSSAFIFEPRDLVPFSLSWDWQKKWQKALLNGACAFPAVWLLEHPNCYTLGRGASEANLNFEPNNPPDLLYRIDRGGEVTFHLPGQLVVYLVLDLRQYKTDLNWYLRQLEQVVIDVLDELGLAGELVEGLTGVWIQGYKVASIGIGCRRWITQHGLALNIDCDLNGFKEIIPCGLVGHKMGRLDSWLPGLKVGEVKPLMRRSLSHRFGWTLFDE